MSKNEKRGLKMRKLKIIGYGVSLPKNTVKFGNQTRYRMTGNETLLSLAVNASEEWKSMIHDLLKKNNEKKIW